MGETSAGQPPRTAALQLLMKVLTEYLKFHTKTHRAYVHITPQVEGAVKKSGVQEGMVLVSAMHITAGVYVNDNESGLIEDIDQWLEKLAPFDKDYRHHQTRPQDDSLRAFSHSQGRRRSPSSRDARVGRSGVSVTSPLIPASPFVPLVHAPRTGTPCCASDVGVLRISLGCCR